MMSEQSIEGVGISQLNWDDALYSTWWDEINLPSSHRPTKRRTQ